MFLDSEDTDNRQNKKADFQKIWKSANLLFQVSIKLG